MLHHYLCFWCHQVAKAESIDLKAGFGKVYRWYDITCIKLVGKGYTVSNYQRHEMGDELWGGIKVIREIAITAYAERYFLDNPVGRYETGFSYGFR